MLTFSVKLIPGTWYFRATCANCGAKHSLFPDPTNGGLQIRTNYRWTCPTCHHNGTYNSEELERYQHPVVQAGSSKNTSRPVALLVHL